MKSKAILPEEEREDAGEICKGNYYTNQCYKALLASESEAQEDKESYLNTIIEKDSKIHELISRIQELEKFIKECKSLVNSNVPEMVRRVKEVKI